MAIGDMYRLTIEGFVEQNVGINVTHWLVTGQTGTGATPAQIAEAFWNKIGMDYAALVSIVATLQKTTAQRISIATNTPLTVKADFIIPGGPNGEVEGDVLPGQDCGLITWKTALPGPRFRGRSYIWFPGEADNDEVGLPTQGYLDRLNALAQSMLGVVDAGDAQDGSELRLAVYSPVNMSATDVDAYTVRTFWGSQNRRRNRRGIA